jgi:hypothetical protein
MILNCEILKKKVMKKVKCKKIEKTGNSNSDADFEPFKIIKCFDFGHIKKY